MNWEFLLNSDIVIISIILSIFLLIFIVKSTKYFPPSDIIAISTSKYSTGEIREDGQTVYSNFTYHIGGGKLFIPFWKDYYVLSAHLRTSTISTEKFLTLDKVHVRTDFVVQYQIDTSTLDKIKEAFVTFADLARHKNEKSEHDISKIFQAHFEKVFKGTVPEILGKMTMDELIEFREKATEKLLNRIREDFLKYNLVITSLKIETIHIENELYRKKLDETVAQRQEIELIKEKNKSENEKLKFEIEEIKRKKELEEEKFKLENTQIELDTQLKLKKIEQNKRFKDMHREEEEYNKAVILVRKRAEKEAELILKEYELKIAQLDNQVSLLKNEAHIHYVQSITQAMKDIDTLTSIMVMLDRNPELIKFLFGKGKLNKFAKNITKHLSKIDGITIADMGSSTPLEKIALLIPSILEQMTTKIKKNDGSINPKEIGLANEKINEILKLFQKINENQKNDDKQASKSSSLSNESILDESKEKEKVNSYSIENNNGQKKEKDHKNTK